MREEGRERERERCRKPDTEKVGHQRVSEWTGKKDIKDMCQSSFADKQ